MGNIKDVFFTKISPSMNDFRSWVHEDTVEIGSFKLNIGIYIISSKEIFHIEVAGKLASGWSMSVPSILQNFDYITIEDNLNEKDRHKDDGLDPFAFPIIQEQRECNQSNRGGDGRVVNERDDERADQMLMDERTGQGSFLMLSCASLRG